MVVNITNNIVLESNSQTVRKFKKIKRIFFCENIWISLRQVIFELIDFRLKNRQAVRGELSQFVDDMVVTEQMISTILEVTVFIKDH